MTKAERIFDFYETFKHRRDMRAKEGLSKWPYMIEEPVDERDWKHFEQYIQDALDGTENPAPWPPAYWDEDDPEE